MGGFKAANTTKKESFSTKFSSSALNKRREDKLNKGLEMQYEHAWETTRQKRGKGLGYDESLDMKDKPSFSFT